MKRKRGLLIVGVLVLAVLVGYGGYRLSAPAPPEIDLRGAPPGVTHAVQKARQAVAIAPRSGEAWGELGLTLQGNEFAPEAYLCFLQAERFDPEAPIWPYLQALRLMVHDREAALEPLKRAVVNLDRAGSPEPAPRLLLAELLFEKDQRSEAAELCQQVLAHDAGNARAQLALGVIALADDAPERGIEHLLHALASPFTGRRASLHLAAAYQRLGDPASATAFLRRASETPAERPWPDPFLQRAKTYQAGPERHAQRAEQLAERGSPGEYLRALRDLAEEAGDGLSHYRLGMALAQQGDYASAEPVLEAAVRKAPQLFSARFTLGVVLLRQGAPRAKLVRAEECLRQALAMRPAYGLAHLTLGQALQALERPAEALTEFRRAVLCQPELADAHLALGEALAAAGDPEEAARHLEQARSLAPADPRPPAALARVRSAGTKAVTPKKN